MRRLRRHRVRVNLFQIRLQGQRNLHIVGQILTLVMSIRLIPIGRVVNPRLLRQMYLLHRVVLLRDRWQFVPLRRAIHTQVPPRKTLTHGQLAAAAQLSARLRGKRFR